jgi:hypothetical protein
VHPKHHESYRRNIELGGDQLAKPEPKMARDLLGGEATAKSNWRRR